MFKFDNSIIYPKLDAVTTDKGRYYTTPDGKVYPSVTTVLGSQDKLWLQKWKDRIGEKEALAELNRANIRGTMVHDVAERYLKFGKLEWHKEHPIALQLFSQIKPFLDKNVEEIWALEESLYSDELAVAGRVDLIGKIQKTLFVIDFKTSNKIKYEEWIQNYFCQASVYAHCFKELFGIEIRKIAIIIANENSSKPSLFIKNSSDYIDKFKEIRKNFRGENN